MSTRNLIIALGMMLMAMTHGVALAIDPLPPPEQQNIYSRPPAAIVDPRSLEIDAYMRAEGDRRSGDVSTGHAGRMPLNSNPYQAGKDGGNYLCRRTESGYEECVVRDPKDYQDVKTSGGVLSLRSPLNGMEDAGNAMPVVDGLIDTAASASGVAITAIGLTDASVAAGLQTAAQHNANIDSLSKQSDLHFMRQADFMGEKGKLAVSTFMSGFNQNGKSWLAAQDDAAGRKAALPWNARENNPLLQGMDFSRNESSLYYGTDDASRAARAALLRVDGDLSLEESKSCFLLSNALYTEHAARLPTTEDIRWGGDMNPLNHREEVLKREKSWREWFDLKYCVKHPELPAVNGGPATLDTTHTVLTVEEVAPLKNLGPQNKLSGKIKKSWDNFFLANRMFCEFHKGRKLALDGSFESISGEYRSPTGYMASNATVNEGNLWGDIAMIKLLKDMGQAGNSMSSDVVKASFSMFREGIFLNRGSRNNDDLPCDDLKTDDDSPSAIHKARKVGAALGDVANAACLLGECAENRMREIHRLGYQLAKNVGYAQYIGTLREMRNDVDRLTSGDPDGFARKAAYDLINRAAGTANLDEALKLAVDDTKNLMNDGILARGEEARKGFGGASLSSAFRGHDRDLGPM